jgi:hypothetical protein
LGGGTSEINLYWKSNQGLYKAILENKRPVFGFMKFGPLQILCKSCHDDFHHRGLHVNSSETEFKVAELLEIINIARMGKLPGILDDGKITVGFVDGRKITEVKIAVDGVEVS